MGSNRLDSAVEGKLGSIAANRAKQAAIEHKI